MELHRVHRSVALDFEMPFSMRTTVRYLPCEPYTRYGVPSAIKQTCDSYQTHTRRLFYSHRTNGSSNDPHATVPYGTSTGNKSKIVLDAHRNERKNLSPFRES